MMDVDDDTRTIYKYYLYRALANPGFTYPIYTLFMLHHGLSYTDIGFIATVQGFIVLFGEVPTGYVGDRIGRRNSLVVASLLFLASRSSYLFVETVYGFTLTFVLLSLGGTFVSGSGDAWLYDTLQEHGSEDRYTHVAGRGSAISKWSMAAMMIAGSLLYSLDRIYPFVVAIGVSVVTLAVVATLPKNAQYAARSDERAEDDAVDEEPFTVLDALPVIRERLTAPSLRSFVVYMALFSGALLTLDMYIQPIVTEVLHIDAATLGVMYAAFTVLSAIASDYASNVEELLGVRRAMLWIPVAVGVFYLLPLAVPVLALPMIFAMKGGGALVYPMSSRYVNDRVESVGRATVLSAINMVYALARIPFAFGSGLLADAAGGVLPGVPGLVVSIAALGGFFLLATVVIHRLAPPVRSGRTAGPGADVAAAE